MLGFALGAVIATMRVSTSPFLQVVAWGYIWAFRSIPLIVAHREQTTRKDLAS